MRTDFMVVLPIFGQQSALFVAHQNIMCSDQLFKNEKFTELPRTNIWILIIYIAELPHTKIWILLIDIDVWI